MVIFKVPVNISSSEYLQKYFVPSVAKFPIHAYRTSVVNKRTGLTIRQGVKDFICTDNNKKKHKRNMNNM